MPFDDFEDWEENGGATDDVDSASMLKAAGMFAVKPRTTPNRRLRPYASSSSSSSSSGRFRRARGRVPAASDDDYDDDEYTQSEEEAERTAKKYPKGLLSGANQLQLRNPKFGKWKSFINASGLAGALQGKIEEPFAVLAFTDEAFDKLTSEEKKLLNDKEFAKAAAKHTIVRIGNTFDSSSVKYPGSDEASNFYDTLNSPSSGTQTLFKAPKTPQNQLPLHAKGKADFPTVSLVPQDWEEDPEGEPMLAHGNIVDSEDVPGIGTIFAVDEVMIPRAVTE